ncbi:MAG: hypothetical protein R2883_00035 [Caldisericia bacterium]
MGKDLFDPFEEEEIVEVLTDDDLEESPKKHWGKIITAAIIILVCLGLVANYIIGRGTFRQSQVGRTIFRTNYTKDGKRYLVNSELPVGYEIVDLNIKEQEFEKQRISKDGVLVKMLVVVNYWPNQNYLDYQYKHHRATSDDAFDIDKMMKDFVFDNLDKYISQNKSSWLLENSSEMQKEIQKLFDEKTKKAFVFEYFGAGKNERLVEYLDVDEINTKDSLETRMFERNMWGNHAYLIESTKNYKKYYVIDDFIRIGSVKVVGVEKVER